MVEENDVPRCVNCKAIVQPSSTFCSFCGSPVIRQAPQPRQDVFEILRPSLLYYFITLILLLVYKTTEAFPDGFEGMIFVSAIDILIVVVFWWEFRSSLKPLISIRAIRLKIVINVFIGAMMVACIVSLIADWINVSINDDEFYSPYFFEDTTFPLATSILFICVQPAIFEEVAFRGFLYNNLKDVTNEKGAVYITSFMFGIIHLSYIGLIWLIPLGIFSALLRFQFKTLWYGVFAHFIYNLTIVLIDYSLILN